MGGRTASQVIRDAIERYAPLLVDRIWPVAGEEWMREHPATPMILKAKGTPPPVRIEHMTTAAGAIAFGKQWLAEYRERIGEEAPAGLLVDYAGPDGLRCLVDPRTGLHAGGRFGCILTPIGGTWDGDPDDQPPKEAHMDKQDRTKKRVHIRGDGTIAGTHVFDEEGAELKLTTSVEFRHQVGEAPSARVKTLMPSIDCVVLDADTGPDPITELRVVTEHDEDQPSPRFVEIENQKGESVGCFEWVNDELANGRYLRIPVKPWQPEIEHLRAHIRASDDQAAQALDRLARIRTQRDHVRAQRNRLADQLHERDGMIEARDTEIKILERDSTQLADQRDQARRARATAEIRSDFLERVLRAAGAAANPIDRGRILSEGLSGCFKTDTGTTTLPAIRTEPRAEPPTITDHEASEGVVPAGAAEGVVPAHPPQHEAALERITSLLLSSLDQLTITYDPQMGGAWIVTDMRSKAGHVSMVRAGDRILSEADLRVLRRFADETAAERRSLEGRIMREVEAKESVRRQGIGIATELEVARTIHREFCEKLEAHISDLHAATQPLIRHLADNDPAWWVEAAGALAKLQQLTDQGPQSVGDEPA